MYNFMIRSGIWFIIFLYYSFIMNYPNFCLHLQVYFHFQTKICNEDETLLDDSRKMGKPMELVLGKKFKMEVWETIVQAMAVGEIAKFTVDKSVSFLNLYLCEKNLNFQWALHEVSNSIDNRQ
jgi:hypothetical protein